MDEYVDIFLNTESTKGLVIKVLRFFSTCAVDQILHCAKFGTTMLSRNLVAGLIKPEMIPPTDGVTAQHSLRAYRQKRDWILLQSMSLNPIDYGWALGVHWYDPVPSLYLMDSDELHDAEIVGMMVFSLERNNQ